MDYCEKTLSGKVVYEGTIFNVEKLTVELPNGHIASRDIIRNPGAAVIIPIIDDCIVLVEQFRKAAEKTFIELPAGKLEYGEDPEACAERELKEETGYSAKKLEKVLSLYPAPAFADEILHIYLATDLEKGEATPDEDEFISSKAYKIEDALAMIDEGTINDGKTVAGILFASRLLNRSK
ncbi:MAG: NUDIX hydrolase [Clostridiaceae bacterium]|jgi:ADP-ribose pyrophosphatase|nr:NUDIX hydrolase [Clostridiaceae bacterium]